MAQVAREEIEAKGDRRNPKILLAAWIAALVGAALFADGWPTDNRIERWGSQLAEDPGWEILRERFGGDESVLLRLDEFDPEDERFQTEAKRLDRQLSDIPAVSRAVSPLSLLGQWPWPEPSTKGPVPRLVGGLELVHYASPRIDFVLSIDPASSPNDRTLLARSLEDWRVEMAQQGWRLRFAGHPLVSAALDKEARRVERTFVPFLVLLAALGTSAFLRSIRLAGLALLPAASASVASRAAARAFLGPSDLILVAVGPITFVLLLAATLHLVLRFQYHVGAGLSPRQAAKTALRDKLPACSLAALTTAVGFGVFRTSALRSVSDLGTLVAATVIVATPLALFGTTYLLGSLRQAGACPASSSRPWRKLAAGVARRRGVIAGIGALFLLSGFFAPERLSVASNGVAYFPSQHPVRQQFESLEAEGAGLSSAEIILERAGQETWTVAHFLELDLAADFLQVEGATHVIGPELVLNTVASGPARLAARTFLHQSGRTDKTDRFARWTVRFPTGESDATGLLLAGLRSVAEAKLPGGSVHISGSVPRLYAMQDTLIGTLATSLGLTLIVTTLLFLLVVRSARELCAALMVNLLPVSAVLLTAVALKIPLDGATTMVAAVVLGLAVDNTLHLIHAAGPAPRNPRARLGAFAEVGGATLVSSFSLALGFGTLLLSGFAPTARFGGLCAAGAAAAWAADMLLLPALLPWKRQPRAD